MENKVELGWKDEIN